MIAISTGLLLTLTIVNGMSVPGNVNATIKPFTDACLDCICEGVGCRHETFCRSNVCGILYMTKLFWIDAQKPVVLLDDPESEGAYQRCANDETCARTAVRTYMELYPFDCNDDGVVDCYDYGAIHNMGRHGCRSPLSAVFGKKFPECLKKMKKE
ncbi:lysozyme isoform X2 [Nilaparvata lugens]|uniref:lysozyme isoform X1 n=1 Tax=Nilaparvata lugens TaxID=108931 RepID=UPI00193C8A5A|nr:lysozyme isoform X1 [Nilaparvata lugens]XP_039284897.1 lysozyme isoform X2 [Nilaparvata lugens]